MNRLALWQPGGEFFSGNAFGFPRGQKWLISFTWKPPFAHSHYSTGIIIVAPILRLHTRSHTLANQCDQIWAKFHHFDQYLKYLAIYLRFIWFLVQFCTICMFLGKFSLLKMAKYWKHNLVVWSHCLTCTKSPSLSCTISFSPSEYSTHKAWGSLVEGDEDSYLCRSQTVSFVLAFHKCVTWADSNLHHKIRSSPSPIRSFAHKIPLTL